MLGDADVIRVGTSELIVAVPQEDVPTRLDMQAPATVTGSPTATAALAGAPAATAAAGGLPGWLWVVTGLVEIALILTAATFLVYYAVG